jgi:hypothetical protein
MGLHFSAAPRLIPSRMDTPCREYALTHAVSLSPSWDQSKEFLLACMYAGCRYPCIQIPKLLFKPPVNVAG